MFRSEVSTQQDIAIRMLTGILTKRDLAVSLECYYNRNYMDSHQNTNSYLYEELFKTDRDNWEPIRQVYANYIKKISNYTHFPLFILNSKIYI